MRAQAVDAVAGPMTGTVAASVREDGLVLVYGALVPASASSLPCLVVTPLLQPQSADTRSVTAYAARRSSPT